MRPFYRMIPCVLAVLLLAPLPATAQKAKAQAQTPPAAVAPAPAEGFEYCAEDWKIGPAAIYGKEDNRFRIEQDLPESCKERTVMYEITGRDKVQKADCDFSVVYGSGGSSEKIRVTVNGAETKKGEVPSYLKEPARRIRVRCFALDEYKPFDARVCVRCGGESGAKSDVFEKDLEKFLKQ